MIMLNFLVSKQSLDFLSSDFPELQFKLLNSGDDDYISCFICKVEDTLILEQHWSHIASLIALNYQAKLNDELKVWNIYLVYILPIEVNNQLKYKIENDKFSMRKIILDDYQLPFEDDANLIARLNSEILGHDIELKHSSITMDDNKTEIQQHIENLGDIPLGNKDGDAESRLKHINKLVDILVNHENKKG
jgi:hypothetical protein